jgi:hypothetical protein
MTANLAGGLMPEYSFDAAMYFENKNPLSNGSLFRRNTFAVKATLWEDWQAEWDIDVSENVLDLRDMFIKYSFPGTNYLLEPVTLRTNWHGAI